jgi:alpha-L-fucosidase
MNSDKQEFTAADIRFTTHDGALYAVALGWPAGGELRVHSLWKGNPYLGGPVCSVQLLGSDDKLTWRQQADGLYIELPQNPLDEPAFTFRILESEGLSGRCGH